jgi:hypothetical protein
VVQFVAEQSWGLLMQEKRIRRSSYGDARPARDFPMLARAYLDGRLMLDEMITQRIPLDACQCGVFRAARGQGHQERDHVRIASTHTDAVGAQIDPTLVLPDLDRAEPGPNFNPAASLGALSLLSLGGAQSFPTGTAKSEFRCPERLHQFRPPFVRLDRLPEATDAATSRRDGNIPRRSGRRLGRGTPIM